ncbi:hypothetical protein [Streptomyces sp. NPDC057115]|uniref:hypothetical protein n=1 Tax=Streptomyces sp. NPDC057115 TaxID=3346022 RepID=UPI003637F04F
MADDSNDHSFTLTTDQTAGITVAPPIPPTIVISGGDGTPMVKIHPNGTLEYGPNYDPNEAARRFWDAMRYHMPTRCSNCGQVGLLEGPQ